MNKSIKNMRWDHQVIFDIIPENASVLDLGCGNGELLKRLKDHKNIWGMGVEVNMDKIQGCIEKGISVYHGDLDMGLPKLPDGFFNYVILEKTLQAVDSPLKLLDEMLRLGDAGVISFSNFGHKGVMDSFIKTQRMPKTDALPYSWYDTPNIHLFTAMDFLDLVDEKGLEIRMGKSWIEGRVVPFNPEETQDAEEILFVVSRKTNNN